MKNVLAGLALGAGFLLSASAALAQTQAAAPADEKVYGDWRVHCGGPAETPCEMLQAMAEKKSGQQIMVTSVIYIPSRDIHLMQIMVPLGVNIPTGVVLKTDTFTSPKLPFNRCERGGCIVALPLNAASIKTITGAGPDGKLTFAFDGAKQTTIRISFNGFAQADDAMVSQAKAKAKSAPAAPAAPGSPAVINGQ